MYLVLWLRRSGYALGQSIVTVFGIVKQLGAIRCKSVHLVTISLERASELICTEDTGGFRVGLQIGMVVISDTRTPATRLTQAPGPCYPGPQAGPVMAGYWPDNGLNAHTHYNNTMYINDLGHENMGLVIPCSLHTPMVHRCVSPYQSIGY